MNHSVTESQHVPTDTTEAVVPQGENEAAQSPIGTAEPTEQPVTVQSLLAIRQSQQMSSEFVAASLRLSNAQILALEAGRWGELPGPAYVKGFLRSYCKLLGIDPMPYIEQYASAVGHNIEKPVAPVAQTGAASSPQLSAPQTLGTFDHKALLGSQRQIIGFLTSMCITATVVFLLVWERDAWVPKFQAQWAKISGAQSNTPPLAPANGSETAQPQQAGVGASNTVPSPDTAIPTPLPVTVASTAPNSNLPVPVKSSEPLNKAAAPAPSAPAIPPVPVVAKTSSTDLRRLETTMVPIAIPNQPPKTAAAPVNAPSAVSAPAPGAAALGTAVTKPNDLGPKAVLELQFISPVWVEVKDQNGVVLLTGLQPANTKNQLKVSQPVFLVVGAAHALRVKLNGQPFDLAPHTIANVARVKI